MKKTSFGLKAIAVGTAVMAVLAMGACGGDDKPTQSANGELSGELSVWGWGNGMKELAEAFEAANPGVTVNYAAQSNASDAAMKLTNALTAGKGAPDVCMLEDAMVSQFAVQEGIIELDQFGAQDYADDFVAGPWGKLQVNGKAYGMPLDSAPEVLYYNKAVFDKAGVTEAPTTWDEYYEAAKKIRELGEDYYITNNAGFQPFTAQAWQAGGHMWTVDGENLTIDMTKSEGMQRYIDFTQKLIDEDLINVRINAWSDDWNRSLNDGTLASLTIGAWMATNLKSSAPEQSGNWRVAPLPKWTDGGENGSEDGGSSFTITAQAKDTTLAWAFVEFATHGEGAQVLTDEGGQFPSLKSILNSDEFINADDEYFGDQKINQVLVEAANQDITQFQYLPYTQYATTIYPDYTGPAYMGKVRLEDALQDYGEALAEYGEQQGYTVTLK